MNRGYRHGQELTVSPLEVISAFGTALGAWSMVAGLWREKKPAVEVESEVFVTKMMRQGYLWMRVVTAKLLAASASGFGHRTRD